MKALILLVVMLVGSNAHAWYQWNGSGYVSNICRYGAFWQVVPYNYVGSGCYMSMYGMYGSRVME